ncbi:MAG: EFR1 family ferrodoxin [Eubacterium sp.]|nr:EFR1 family ferrodoxin [Eubacterium sp.]
MNIKKVKAVYFSPCKSTGKLTERIAFRVAKLLDVPAEIIDFTLPKARENKYLFKKDELAVFGLPTYAGRIPNKILPFVKEGFLAESTPAICIVTYGNRSFDSSLTELLSETGNNGFKALALSAWPCRHVFSDKIAIGRPSEEDLKKADYFAERARDLIKKYKSADDIKSPSIPGKEEVLPYYSPKKDDGEPAVFLKAKPKTDSGKCINCGVCASVCPMGSVSYKNFSEVNGICIKCQACIKNCPEQAKYFDDEAFLSHVRMLENNFTAKKEPEIYI